jgi:SAM-dependent methyltransferase
MMPHSEEEGKGWVVETTLSLVPAHPTVLDVGAGAGRYGQLYRPHAGLVDAVEIWGPYIDQFNLSGIYDTVFNQDIRTVPLEDLDYDIVVFGDIMEHMPKEEAVEVWERVARSACRVGAISLPIVHWPQGPYEGNPYEAHVKDDWTVEEVLDSFKGIDKFEKFNQTAGFVARWNDD